MSASPSLVRAFDDESPRPPRFLFFTDEELASVPPPSPAIDGMLYRDTLASIVAKWESYKTFLALEMGFCMAVGADYNGRKVTQGVVVYITAEGGHGIAKRVAALRAKYGNFKGQVPLLIHPGVVLVNEPDQVAAMISNVLQKIDTLDTTDAPIVAVFIDTVARNMRGDENSVADMGAMVAGMTTIRERTGACVVCVHHTGWDGERSRGSTALPSAVDTEIFLARDEERVTVKNTKQKDAARFADFALEAMPMARSLVLMPFAPTSSNLSKNELAALAQVQDEPGLTSTEWEKASGLADGSYNNARRRLLSLAYVKQSRKLYIATDAGKQAFGARCNLGASEVQS